MHLLTIIAFALLFWRSDGGGAWLLVGPQDVAYSVLIAAAIPALTYVLAWLLSGRVIRLIRRDPGLANAAQSMHHVDMFLLKAVTIVAFAGLVLCTNWPTIFDLMPVSPWLQILGDMAVLAPFLVAIMLQWLAIYPVDRALRRQVAGLPPLSHEVDKHVWPFHRYFDFHLRHHILVIAVPMACILMAANLTSGYSDLLRSKTNWEWTPDTLLGMTALVVFLLAPAMLRRIWRTRPLEAGPVRARLEALGARIGLRFRRILVWDSDGLMINAAVMGIVPQVRYVMLSDALLESMTPQQIAAVFGHEAGHVRHHHIQYFLLFAIIGWILVAGLMEGLALWASGQDGDPRLSIMTIQGIGILTTVLIWGIGFGWVSRRFERHADLFGARCVTPSAQGCAVPCSVHPDTSVDIISADRVCASGVAVFISALDRVAALNGIPHDERSWRHSSIGSRITHLTGLAGDPNSACSFERTVRWIMRVLVVAAVLGGACTALYCLCGPTPALLQMESGRGVSTGTIGGVFALAAIGAWVSRRCHV